MKGSFTFSPDESGNIATSSHIFNDPTFWKIYKLHVESKAWSCNFPINLLTDTLEEDSKLYTNDTIFRQRRQGALKWVNNDTLWITLVLGASKEIANNLTGIYTKQLQDLHMMEAFKDYVDHIDYFSKVATVMKDKGQTVHVFSQDFSHIHDIDKLDPVMMVGYSERFEDIVSTSVWDHCVERHTTVNPHHQAHCVWNNCCLEAEKCSFCDNIRTKALGEMVCDKVSRRVQKNLGGHMSDEMWDVETAYFKGLPENWLEKAMELLRKLKHTNTK
ncbi:uncharacterized protein TNCV_4595031 [Trichonephila clavipes]|uniref:Uncharacterized protein n=1 Tax=Trichonephila clavipes TaxID=2585209 RepID=A0A8X6WGZ7_TRICX|nr:uncharacterized protein TNCV_4595031 [Trichonephila clavipes]